MSKAGAALVKRGVAPPATMSAIVVDDPAEAMARVVDLFWPEARRFDTISPRAAIGRGVELGPEVGIGPFVFIGDDVRIGARTEIHPSATIGDGTVIGADCRIHAGVHIYPGVTIGDRVILHSGVVIGADGFGYRREPSAPPVADEPFRHRKIRQIGRVVIEDDVEIGANTTIDRAALATTRIGRGTKIDNLVTVGHNVQIGRHCIVAGQAGISGSTVLEDYVTVAGQAGLSDHLVVGVGARIDAQAGAIRNVAAGTTVMGSPALDVREARNLYALLRNLPEFRKELAAHSLRLAQVERAESATADLRSPAGSE
jgi:UDP-3-O-[3-hydroxymyristoyl] glucosamine N-acyltransferase